MLLDAVQFFVFLCRHIKSRQQSSRTILGTFLYAFAGLVAIKIGNESIGWGLFVILLVGLLFYHCMMLIILPFLITKIIDKGELKGS